MAAGETEKEGDVHMQQLGNSLKGVLSVYEGLCNLKRVKLFPHLTHIFLCPSWWTLYLASCELHCCCLEGPRIGLNIASVELG